MEDDDLSGEEPARAATAAADDIASGIFPRAEDPHWGSNPPPYTPCRKPSRGSPPPGAIILMPPPQRLSRGLVNERDRGRPASGGRGKWWLAAAGVARSLLLLAGACAAVVVLAAARGEATLSADNREFSAAACDLDALPSKSMVAARTILTGEAIEGRAPGPVVRARLIQLWARSSSMVGRLEASCRRREGAGEGGEHMSGWGAWRHPADRGRGWGGGGDKLILPGHAK